MEQNSCVCEIAVDFNTYYEIKVLGILPFTLSTVQAINL